MMKFKFDPNQKFQIDAINSILDIFEGQGKNCHSPISSSGDFFLGIYPNKIDIDEETIRQNIQKVQERNRIDAENSSPEMDFSVEMETATGKTYVYLRTIFELNKKYNFKKFIILVPSVAIREGVIKTLEITEEHFQGLYDNVPYRYYEYVSKSLSAVKHFAQSNNIEIMVMTMGAFNKDENILYSSRDQMQGEQPISYIQKTNPILIMDEPQNMEGEATQEKLKNFNSLFRLRYSATHRNLYNLIYQLTPYDAYQLGLVKKIEVFSVVDTDDDEGPRAFLDLIEVTSSRTTLKAKVEVLVKDSKNNLKKKVINLQKNDDLAEKTNNRMYDGYIADDMTADAPDFGSIGSIKFKNGVEVKRGQEITTDKKDIMRAQIRSTIERHIEKRQELKKKGIKTLSLFFIDKVDNFVKEDGFIRKTFDEVFNELKKDDKELTKLEADVVRKAYFAEKNGEYLEREKSIEENKEAYDLIMKDKERLLSFGEPTEFIFTHSALKEGWDNPNVFNICTLNATVSTMRKRQEIGRGMRLCVNQNGERIFDRNINLLSIIANEHYANYVSALQTEFVEDGIYKAPPTPSNARKRRVVKLRKGFAKDPHFEAIWGRVSQKTRYSVKVNSDRLTKACIDRINALTIPKRQISITRVGVNIKKDSVDRLVIGESQREATIPKMLLDCINYIKDETKLTRETVIKILKGVSPKLFLNNPERFLFEASRVINEALTRDYIEQISYSLSGEKFDVSQFEEIVSHKDSVQDVKNKQKSIYDGVVFSSTPEQEFAVELDRDERIKLFIKLPVWFTVKTPIGGYTPDWAIVTAKIDTKGRESSEKIYFVIETKSTTSESERRGFENQKIQCAKKHFEVVRVNYKDVASYRDFEALLK
ncbi:MAG TPA: DEAD/DEAH box helicase family protein [Candidatus Omnitrophota bacterium]|nr:DEAD/DEAH box helicase family protein [Candidatus Omnitrophota bacterium]HPD85508.1 DEAD/DEAH box helicase family protein [Candidatus Omnitrophota bacterium]HRZ03991.1 DEAD/DEAH box helicase family protein [Candidatus Omnitrophota bacterium]